VHRPVYAPALVTFIGSPGWNSITVVRGARPIGWVPLAPHEAFRPHYRASPAYVRNINVTIRHTTFSNSNVNSERGRSFDRFANRDAATVVSASAFTRSAAVHRSQLALPREEIARAVPSNDIGRVRPQWRDRAPAAAGADRAPGGVSAFPRTREDRPTRIERNAVRDVAPAAGRATAPFDQPDRRELRRERPENRPSAVLAPPSVRAAEPGRAPPSASPQASPVPVAPTREQAERFQRQSPRQALPSPQPSPAAPVREQAERFNRQSSPEAGREARNFPSRVEAPRATVAPQVVAPRPVPQAVAPVPQPQVATPRAMSPRDMHQSRIERPAPPVVQRAPVQPAPMQVPQAVRRAPAQQPQAVQRAPQQPQAVQQAPAREPQKSEREQSGRGHRGGDGGIAERFGAQRPGAMR
jgi:hypothetical protein